MITIGHTSISHGLLHVAESDSKVEEPFGTWPEGDYRYFGNTFALIGIRQFSSDGVSAEIDLNVSEAKEEDDWSLIAEFSLTTESHKVYVGDVTKNCFRRFAVPDDKTIFSVYVDSLENMKKVFVVFKFLNIIHD